MSDLRQQLSNPDCLLLSDVELCGAIITAVMSCTQSARNDACLKLQRHILRVEADGKALAAEVAALRDDAERYYRVMDALREADRFKDKHGRCQPRVDRACSACNAADVIAEMLAAYKGRRIVLADAARGADSATTSLSTGEE